MEEQHHDEMTHSPHARQEGFWLKAASWTFGLWALMLPITANMILKAVEKVANQQDRLMQEFIVYREADMSRMATIEAQHSYVLSRINKLEEHRDHPQEKPNADN